MIHIRMFIRKELTHVLPFMHNQIIDNKLYNYYSEFNLNSRQFDLFYAHGLEIHETLLPNTGHILSFLNIQLLFFR